MRFGDAISHLAMGAYVKLGSALQNTRLQFLELVTSQPFYTPPKGDATSLIALYNSSPWVRSIVGKIGNDVGKQDWYVQPKPKKKGAKKVPGERVEPNYEHPAAVFLRTGSPMLRGKQARALTQKYIDLAGEAFWAIGRGPNGKPVQFAPMPPHWVTDIPHEGQPNYVIQPRSGVQFQIEPKDVLWFRDPNPADPYGRGASLVGAARTELSTDEAASTFLDYFFKNRARPDILVSGTDTSPINDKDRARLEQTWLEKFRGVNRTGKPFFSAKPLLTQELGFGLRDNAVPQMRDQLKVTIGEIFGVPPEIFGRLENSNRATIDSADFLYGSHVLEPRLMALHDVIEAFVDAEFGLGGQELCYDSPVRKDTTQALSVMQAFPGCFTGNEKRELADYEPMEGLEDLPPDPMDMMTDPNNPDGPGGLPDDGDGADKEDPKEEDAEKPKPDKAAPPAVRKILSAEDIVRVSAAHLDPEVVAEATAIMDRIYSQLLRSYGADLLEQLESDVRFQTNMRIADWLIGKGSNLLGKVDDTTRKELSAALVSGVADGAGLDELISQVEDIFAAAAETRAILIGQTAATQLTGFATKEAAKQAGIGRKQWITSHDQVVRESHQQLDGVTIGLEEWFVVESGAKAQHPGDFGEAKEDAGCRCAIRPVFDEEDKAFNGPGYRQWHGQAYERTADKFADKISTIFDAQKRVVIMELRRSMRALGA